MGKTRQFMNTISKMKRWKKIAIIGMIVTGVIAVVGCSCIGGSYTISLHDIPGVDTSNRTLRYDECYISKNGLLNPYTPYQDVTNFGFSHDKPVLTITTASAAYSFYPSMATEAQIVAALWFNHTEQLYTIYGQARLFNGVALGGGSGIIFHAGGAWYVVENLNFAPDSTVMRDLLTAIEAL